MKKSYQKPSAEWISFRIEEELASIGSPGTGPTPFSLDEDTGFSAADGNYTSK